MSSGRDEWMSRWSEEDKARNLQGYKGVTGKTYQQLEFDFSEPEDLFSFLSDSDTVLHEKAFKHQQDIWRLKDEVGNAVLQADAIVKMVMDNMGGNCGSGLDDYEFALWGASELLQKAAKLLE